MPVPTKTLKIGYVPEHFSSPLLIALNEGYFQRRDVSVELICCPSGTGEMIQKMADGGIDIALALTEGLTASISNGADHFRIIGTYVDVPLCWAISTGRTSEHTSVDTLRSGRIAVSRIGSGSHIMPFVLADQHNWLDSSDQAPFSFDVRHTFQAMRNAVNNGSADAFLWETFTTKPYHDTLEVRKIGEIIPPWPAFLIACRKETLSIDQDAVKRLLLAINDATAHFIAHKDDMSASFLQQTFNYNLTDIQEWFKTVQYPADSAQVSRKVLEGCVHALLKAGVVKSKLPPEDFCDLHVAKLID